MLNYSHLFSELESLFASAGHDPASYRRLSREVRRVRESLDDYTHELSQDYVLRLEQRLARGEAQLEAEEVELLRAYLGVAPADPRAERRLLDDLAALEAELEGILTLRDQPLRLSNLGGFQARLALMETLLPGVVRALEERQRRLRFEAAAGVGGGPVEVEWLLRELRLARGDGTPGAG